MNTEKYAKKNSPGKMKIVKIESHGTAYEHNRHPEVIELLFNRDKNLLCRIGEMRKSTGTKRDR